MDRIAVDHLQATWRRAGFEGLDQCLAVSREGAILDLLLTVCPHPRYAGWLSGWRRRRWATDGFLSPMPLSLLREARTALTAFHVACQFLPPAGRDIGQYRELEELFLASSNIPEPSRRKLRAVRKYRALSESAVINDSGAWVLIEILGPEAARFWGLGTRWCTAGETGGYFERYAARGRLLVLKTPSGKYQFVTNPVDCRDELDREVDLAIVVRDSPAAFRSEVVLLAWGLRRPYCDGPLTDISRSETDPVLNS